MKYVIDKNKNDKKLTYYNVNIKGLEVKPINEVPNQQITIGKILLVDEELTDSFIKKRINRKLDRIMKFMIRILNDDDSTEEDTGMVLDEINRLKGSVLNKYRHYMKDAEYKSLLTKLILIEEEFKKSYNEKMFMTMSSNIYEGELSSFRGR